MNLINCFIFGLLTFFIVACNGGGSSSGGNSDSSSGGTSGGEASHTVPDSLTSLSRFDPINTNGTDSTPTLTVNGAVSGDTVKIFTDSSCSTEVGSATATGSSVNVTSSALSLGIYVFYANSTNSYGTSTCSSASVSYAYGNGPTSPSSISRQSPTNAIGTDPTPTLTVNGTVSGNTVKIFTDSSCSTEVGSAAASGSSVNITSSALSLGSYVFYANSTNSYETSNCSTASVLYTYATPYAAVTTAALNSGLQASFVNCGIGLNTIPERIENCSLINNGSTVNYNLALGKIWKLVYRKASYKLWLDVSANRIWSASVGGGNWCLAVGDANGADPGNDCNNSSRQPGYPGSAQSFCLESPAVSVSARSETGSFRWGPDSWTRISVPSLNETWASGIYHDSKGGIGLNSSLSVTWMPPSFAELQTAYNNGYKDVVSNGNHYTIWSTAVSGTNDYYAWYFHGSSGGPWDGPKRNGSEVRCIMTPP